MADDGRPWWFVPERSRNLSAPVAAVLLAMGTADLVRAGVSFWLGWLQLCKDSSSMKRFSKVCQG